MPKIIKSIRLSAETLNQFDKYANFIEKLTGKKPNLSKTSDEALLFYTHSRLLGIANEMARVIQEIDKPLNQESKSKTFE